MWPRPGKEPLVDVDRAVLITVHHQATVLVGTAIRPFPQGHVLLVFAHMTHLGGIALADDREFFPKAHTLILKHVDKAVETQSLYTMRLRMRRLDAYRGLQKYKAIW